VTTEDDFQAKLDADPSDWQTRLVFADWLEENAGEVDCPRCGGDGVHTVVVFGKPNPAMKGRRACQVCSGTGRVSDGRKERAEGYRALGRLRLMPHLRPGGSCFWQNTMMGLNPHTRSKRPSALGPRWHRLVCDVVRRNDTLFASRRAAEDAAALAFAQLPAERRAELLRGPQ
jgi:uncharacterized protein (TIGR02996 family)